MPSPANSPQNHNPLQNAVSLTQAIKQEAHRLGFHLVGVTTPATPTHYSVYENWLDAGLHGEMAYLGTREGASGDRARECRANPLKLLPECQSILLLGVRYFPPKVDETGFTNPSLTGRVASYAWGDDYHDVLPKRMKALVRFIEERAGHSIPNRYYTDTGPVLERDLAQRAGLGWIGKNTCLIHPDHGSYILLAEILLGIALETDPPFTFDHCGSCTRCLDACPTVCILPNRTIDATRCISYLTIELKSAIPLDLRPQLGNWVFGCDICQEVCPWNIRFASPNGDGAFAPRPNLPLPGLLEEIHLTPEAFNQKFKNSPVKRAKRRGYLRNVAIALGNSGRAEAVPDLAAALHDPEPLVRSHAAWALGQIGGEAARKALAEADLSEADPEVRREIAQALATASGNVTKQQT